MKIRNIPFGYEVVGGRYVVNNGEAEIISSIYNMYLSGKTLLGIAEALTEQEVTYFEDTKVWNKNMVSRILADERYLGNETFPRLVDSNNFNLAKNIRAEKGGKKAVLTPLMATVKDMLFCAECGETFSRINKWRTREKWICKGKCKCSVYLDDRTICESILSVLNRAIREPNLQKTFRSNCIDKKAKVNRGELPKYLVSNNHPPIIDRDTFNIVQVELARRCSKKSKSDFALTERGKHSGIYALSDILVCGSCGAHYKRKGKTKNGQRIVYWRCINRIEHGTKICKDSIGVEEKKLHAAICRCLSKMMSNRDEVVELIRNNLQYALTGNDSVLDVYAIENQIQSYYDQMSILLDRLYSTGGEAEKYELEIKKINDKIAALREQLSTEKAKATSSDDLNREVERILNYIAQTDKDTFVEYDDVTVRRLVECITVSNDGRIVVTLKGGFRGEEII